MIDSLKKIQSLEETSKHIIFQVATTQTAFKIQDKNENQLQEALNNILKENSDF